MCQPGEKIQPPKNEQVCLEIIKTNVLFEQTEVFKLVVLKISYFPLQDGRGQHSTGTDHLITIDVKSSFIVAVDNEATGRVLLHDGGCGSLVPFIISWSQSMSSRQKWTETQGQETKGERSIIYISKTRILPLLPITPLLFVNHNLNHILINIFFYKILKMKTRLSLRSLVNALSK